MKKVYIRAGQSPLLPVPIETAIQDNLFGQNSGNLVYQYSVFRTLMRPETQFIHGSALSVFNSPGGIERLNEACDIAVFPLANAFRPDFELKPLTALIRALKIPCVVVGCGVQAKRPEELREGFPFDDDARAFVSAVLDKSALLGLRGEYTAEYLKRLGFAPERHFTVIGCPSLFRNGAQMPEPRVSPITPATRFSVNTMLRQPPELNALIADTERRYPGFHLVLQTQRELAMLAFGTINGPKNRDGDATGFYPYSPRHRDVREGRAVGFTEARTWFDYMAREVDYSFGSRLHGNLSAVTSGVPAFVFTSDVRTEEICRYGNVPHMPIDRLRGGASIEQVLEKADFGGVCRGYEKRFAHFIDFLNANGVDHIYRETARPEVVPFDEAMKAVPVGGYVRRGCVPAPVARRHRLAFYSAKLKKRLGISRRG